MSMAVARTHQASVVIPRRETVHGTPWSLTGCGLLLSTLVQYFRLIASCSSTEPMADHNKARDTLRKTLGFSRCTKLRRTIIRL